MDDWRQALDRRAELDRAYRGAQAERRLRKLGIRTKPKPRPTSAPGPAIDAARGFTQP